MASEEEEAEMLPSEEEEEEVVVGQMPTVMVPKHINRRSLKNKALSISFDEKALRDFVTGFHKRKKKRRKEAQKQLQEKDRLRRIAARKKRKEEKEIALYGRVLSSGNPEGAGTEGGDDDAGKDHDGAEADGGLSTLLSETRTYEDDSTRITVTTSEISREDDDPGAKSVVPVRTSYTEKNHSLAVKKNSGAAVKKKPSKRNLKKSKAHKRSKKHEASKDKRKGKGKKR